jgi:hypothetical protein
VFWSGCKSADYTLTDYTYTRFSADASGFSDYAPGPTPAPIAGENRLWCAPLKHWGAM